MGQSSGLRRHERLHRHPPIFDEVRWNGGAAAVGAVAGGRQDHELVFPAADGALHLRPRHHERTAQPEGLAELPRLFADDPIDADEQARLARRHVQDASQRAAARIQPEQGSGGFNGLAGGRGEVGKDEHAFHATKVKRERRLKGDVGKFGLKNASFSGPNPHPQPPTTGTTRASEGPSRCKTSRSAGRHARAP